MKLIFCLFALSLSFLGRSQNRYAIFGGVQTTTANYKVGGNKQATTSKLGGQLGIMGKYQVEGNLYFTPSVYYSLKGFGVDLKDKDSLPGIDVSKNDLTINVMEISPLINIDLSSKPGHFFIQFGPSIDVAAKGTERLTLDNGNRKDRNMKFSSTKYGRITSSAIGRLGYETSHGLIVFAHYTYGLGSMNNADFGPSIRHRIFGISIGKYFKGNPNVLDTRVKE